MIYFQIRCTRHDEWMWEIQDIHLALLMFAEISGSHFGILELFTHHLAHCTVHTSHTCKLLLIDDGRSTDVRFWNFKVIM